MSRSAFLIDGGIQIAGNNGELQYKDGNDLGASASLKFENGVLSVSDLNVTGSTTGITTSASEAANNGNPIHLKYELEQLPDTLPLDNWLTIKQEMIDDIDIFLS